MASTIVVPSRDRIENYLPAAAEALIDVATKAKADIDANVTASLSAATPADVGAAGVAGSSPDASKADHVHADPQRAAAGTNLTDADETVAVADGLWRKLPTVTASRTKTISATGATAGMQLTITRSSTSAFTVPIVNGGSGAGTIFTMPASKNCYLKLQFDGTDWAVREFGVGS